ncbi:MAG: HAMP domain-containing sensor histidine kinase, partial [Ignavibacteria bacterium]|nr:HAMP domain-containing sensor histidine kinase [Ignavibacteria bacterium]
SPNITTEKKNEYLRIIQGETARLSRLIDNVLDLAKIERGVKDYNFEQTELNEIVSSVLSAMEYQIKMNDFTLEVFLSPVQLPIYADKDAIEEALINLISNSIKYSQENKKITITTYNEGTYPAISIKDKGIGISTQDRQRIFEPYERLNNEHVKSKSGTGIGLSVVKHIVQAHHAEIDIKSESGEGTEFVIIFVNFSSRN